jgi:hypothetical protein
VRCHDRPGHETDPEDAIRIATTPGGTWAQERFDDGAEVWVSVVTLARETCWLPADRIRRIGPGEVVPELSGVSTAEIDIAIERANATDFVALEEAGLVERFDDGDRVVGVRLTIDPVTGPLGAALLGKLRD